jgi:hypothetical protein
MTEFRRLGWAAFDVTGDDLGTDLVVMARDERSFDPGRLVGVQVKTGPTRFARPQKDPSGAVVGWWFVDRRREHLDHWASFSVPHLLVLWNLDTRTSYWVHVTQDKIVSTGVGAKILVPAANSIDEQHRQALLEAAATGRQPPALEGSAWAGAQGLAPRDLLRYALTVPRLIAPHPNSPTGGPLSSAQAVALVARGRLEQWRQRAAGSAEVPSPEQALLSPEWGWRFAAAVADRYTSGATAPLQSLLHDAPDCAARSACAAVLAAAQIERGEADQALVVLDEVLSEDDAEPVDHSWLRVQHARACIEVGRLREARATAIAVQGLRGTHGEDVTATGLAGVAAELLFYASDWGDKDVQAMISGGDTVASWWRNQSLARGLAAAIEQRFTDWAPDPTTVLIVGGPAATSYPRAAALTASHLGDHPDWQYPTELTAQHTLQKLSRTADHEAIVNALKDLRLAGASDSLEAASRRLVCDGPWETVRVAASQVELARSTRTTAAADLDQLRCGAVALDTATADRATAWLLDTLAAPAEYLNRVTRFVHIETRLLTTLSPVVTSASDTVQAFVIERILALPEGLDEVSSRDWAAIAGALESAWSAQAAQRAGELASRHEEPLRRALRRIAARHHLDTRTQLITQIRDGSLTALADYGDSRDLPEDAVAAALERLHPALEAIVAQARASHTVGQTETSRIVAVLNVAHPAAARWDALLTLLEEPSVDDEYKIGPLETLARSTERLSDGLRERLAVTARVLEQNPEPPGPDPDTPRGVRAEAVHLHAALDPDEHPRILNTLVDLIAGDSKQRSAAARIARHLPGGEALGILATLAHDSDCVVRADAAASVALRVAAGGAGPLAEQTLQRALQDTGLVVPGAIATALTSTTHELSQPATAAVTELRGHPSSAVRRRAQSRA